MSLFFSFSALETLTEKDTEYMKYLNIITKHYDKKYNSVFNIKNQYEYTILKFLYTLWGFRTEKTIMNLFIRFFK